jgi:hypothetical protein
MSLISQLEGDILEPEITPQFYFPSVFSGADRWLDPNP